MLKTVEKIFNNFQGDGWSQSQREALLDLLLLGLHVDRHVSLAEMDFVEDMPRRLGWESNISFDGYFLKAVAKVRAAQENHLETEKLLLSIRDRLGDQKSRQRAVNELEAILFADGIVQPERKFIEEIKSLLFT